MIIKEYLKNDICKFTPLFTIDYSKKNNLICASFFKLDTSYKDFNLYKLGIINTYNYIKNNYKDYKFRLFIDNLIYNDKEIMNILLQLKDLEIVLYTYLNKFININIGLLGSLIRLFPMFNFPNNDSYIVLIIDIDHENMNTKYLKNRKTFTIFDEFNKNNINIDNIYLIKYDNLANSLKYKFKLSYKNNLNIYTNATYIINIKKIDYYIIINYINKVFQNKKLYTHFLFNKKENIVKYIEINKPFIYGIDEYFINTTLTKYLIKNNLGLVINYNLNLFEILFNIKMRLSKLNIFDRNENKLFNYIINIIENNIKNSKLKYLDIFKNFFKFDMFTKLLSLEHIINDNNEKINRQLYKIIYKIYLFCKNKKEYNFIFPKMIYKILKKYNKVYELEKIIFINLEYNDIVIKTKKI